MASYNLLNRIHRPYFQPFIFGVIAGLTLGWIFSYIYNGLNIDFLRFKEDVILDPIEIGNHLEHEDHHMMMNSTLADQLFSEVKILCWIMTGPKNHETKAKHVRATWGKRCNFLIFMSTEEDPSLPSVALPVTEDRAHLWAKTKEAFKYIYQYYLDKADWFFKADDDTYAIMENMRYMLHDKNTSEPVYYGFRMKPYVRQGYMSGGSGYVLSKEALRRFVNDSLPDSSKCKKGDTGSEDLEIGKCLEAVGVKAGDSRDSLGRNRFFPVFLTDLLIPGRMPKNYWLWQYHYYPLSVGMNCCSDNPISIHYVKSENMYLLDYLLYHATPFGLAYNPTLNNNMTNKPTNTPRPRYLDVTQPTTKRSIKNGKKLNWNDYN